MRVLKTIVLPLLIVVAFSSQAAGQTAEKGDVEISVLSGVTILGDREGGDNITVIGIPYVAPGFRMTFLGNTPLTGELGISMLTLLWEGESSLILDLEGGLGATWNSAGSQTTMFATGLLGILSFSSDGWSESSIYIGGQAGIKTPINDYTSFRTQVGYRYSIGEEITVKALEFALGLSFRL